MVLREIAALALLAGFCGSPGMAATPTNLCRSVAAEVRATVTPAQTNGQGPLEALVAAGDKSILLETENPAGWLSGVARADRLREHAAPEALVDAVKALGDNVNLIALPGSPILIFDRSVGSLGCHMLVAAWVPKGAAAQSIDLPFGKGEADLCGATVKGAEISGQPALITEEDTWGGEYANAALTLTPFEGPKAASSCEVDVRYAVALRAEHAFCRQSVDCGAIMRMAEKLADQRRAGGDPAALAGKVTEDQTQKLRAAYGRMQQLYGQTQNLDIVPTFNKFASVSGADQFGQDEELVPFRIGSGEVYLGRLGHGHRGVIESVGYIFAAYRLSGDRTVPVAGVSIEPRRAAIVSVKVK